MSPRVYVRRFDHAEARRRYAAGERIVDLAREYGVTDRAIDRVVHRREAAQLAYNKRWRTGVCDDCGGPAMRPMQSSSKKPLADGLTLCHRCRSIRLRERLRFDEQGSLVAVRCAHLDCANGERWQPPENFPRGVQFRDVREGGIHGSCRACGTRARQAYRKRHRVPCERCGKPCLPAGEKGPTGANRALCRACYRETELPDHHRAAVAASARARRGRAVTLTTPDSSAAGRRPA